ncbi:MAG: hypothetical protein IKA40_05830, partial [Clostridia bacterium]|nr:hypothetical protein [Clostridia bacterium]
TTSATSYHKVRAFTSASFDKESRVLSISGFEDVAEIEVYIGTSQNDAALHTYPYLEGSDNFTKMTTNVGYQFLIKINIRHKKTSWQFLSSFFCQNIYLPAQNSN